MSGGLQPRRLRRRSRTHPVVLREVPGRPARHRAAWPLCDGGRTQRVRVVRGAGVPHTRRPAAVRGTAWEPIPGPTPYTKDSELMNAETAAWGRAIIAAGIPSKKIASSQEVQARQEPKGEEPRTKAQNAKMHALLGELDEEAPLPDGDWKQYAKTWIGAQFGKHSSTELTKTEAGLLIDHLEAQKVPFG